MLTTTLSPQYGNMLLQGSGVTACILQTKQLITMSVMDHVMAAYLPDNQQPSPLTAAETL